MGTSLSMETPIYGKGWEDESQAKENSRQPMPRNSSKMEKAFANCSPSYTVAPRNELGLSLYEIMYRRPHFAPKSKQRREIFLTQEVK